MKKFFIHISKLSSIFISSLKLVYSRSEWFLSPWTHMTHFGDGKKMFHHPYLLIWEWLTRELCWELWDHVPTLGKGSHEECGSWRWHVMLQHACYVFNNIYLTSSWKGFPQKTVFFVVFFFTEAMESRVTSFFFQTSLENITTYETLGNSQWTLLYKR